MRNLNDFGNVCKTLRLHGVPNRKIRRMRISDARRKAEHLRRRYGVLLDRTSGWLDGLSYDVLTFWSGPNYVRRSVVFRGRLGDIEVWWEDPPHQSRLSGDLRYCGGVERHLRPNEERPATQSGCSILGGPCAHDGSSLAFAEQIGPVLQRAEGQITPDVIRAICDIARRWLVYVDDPAS